MNDPLRTWRNPERGGSGCSHAAARVARLDLPFIVRWYFFFLPGFQASYIHNHSYLRNIWSQENCPMNNGLFWEDPWNHQWNISKSILNLRLFFGNFPTSYRIGWRSPENLQGLPVVFANFYVSFFLHLFWHDWWSLSFLHLFCDAETVLGSLFPRPRTWAQFNWIKHGYTQWSQCNNIIITSTSGYLTISNP